MNLSQDQQNSLTKSIEKASELLNSVNNPEQALTKANVNTGFIDKLRGYLNNPLYSMMLPLVGLNKSTALKNLNAIENMIKGNENHINDLSSNTTERKSVGGDLERFKNGLNSFKK